MRKFIVSLLLVFSATSLLAATTVLKITRVSSTNQRLNAEIENAPLSSVVKALEFHLTQPVVIETGADRVISYRSSGLLADALLHAIVEQEGLSIESRDGWLAIRDPNEATVNLDVKDAEIAVILGALKDQCGIRNLLIDPEVKDRKGTFLFTEVPCTVALQVVFNSLGLAGEMEPNSVLRIDNLR